MTAECVLTFSARRAAFAVPLLIGDRRVVTALTFLDSLCLDPKNAGHSDVASPSTNGSNSGSAL